MDPPTDRHGTPDKSGLMQAKTRPPEFDTNAVCVASVRRQPTMSSLG